ncbi:MAG: N-acetylmuramoyl-L-alanine amidase [Nocardioidaceae bacterium]
MQQRVRRLLAAAAAVSTASALAVSSPGAAASNHRTADRVRCAAPAGHGPAQRQAAFAAASRAAGVPESVLLAVSYMESRWDAHGSSPSTAGGYGPMNLTDVGAGLDGNGRGTGSPVAPRMSLQTIKLASQVTGASVRTLQRDASSNICGGAAVLAYYQRATGQRTGAATSPAAWGKAVARYSGATDAPTAQRFVGQVYRELRGGVARTTNDGQRVRLAPTPGIRTPVTTSPAARASQAPGLDCPKSLDCISVPAPYQWYDHSNPGYYGNHDLANRPHDLKIRYIVIHDTEGSWDTAMQLVQDPTYLAWNYTVRSSDGLVAQHLDPKNVGWHAGNWYVNMHSIGIEHEGFAAQGASWYTEAMYQDSASLVRYLTKRFDIPRDRAHIIGHDQVPGITPPYVAGMHWDPGPYWDWQHYMALVGAPITRGTNHGQPQPGDTVTVAPGFTGNQQPVTGCDGNNADPCPAQGTNFVYLHTAPDASSPLVPDIGLHPDGSPSTTFVSDWGPRAAAGQKLVVAQRAGDWVGVWWSGQLGWIYSPKDHPTVLRSHGVTVTAMPGANSVPVYGRAYPEAAAYAKYGGNIPTQSVVPLQYSIKAGQRYVLADHATRGDYYYAVTYNCQYAVDDCTDVVGQDKYYEIWFGHRIAYVRAADVRLTRH